MKKKVEKSISKIGPKDVGPILGKEVGKLMKANPDNQIKQTEVAATSMMQTGQQMLLVVEDIMEKDFKFKTEDIRKFETRLTEMLQTLAYVDRMGFEIMNPGDMEVVGELVRNRMLRMFAEKEGLVLPSPEDIRRYKKLEAKDGKRTRN